MPRETCPKCSNPNAWYVLDNYSGLSELALKCVCGYYSIVYSENKNGTAITKVQSKKRLKLPRVGTKLSKCLGRVALHHPEIVQTGQIAKELEESSSDIASQLMVLRHKGLVLQVENCRGKSGGSTWRLSNRTIGLLKI